MFRPPNTSVCVLCGSSEQLSGEHKIKASALRQEFGDASLTIGVPDEPDSLRHAQSVKSKNLHFRSRLCAACNSQRTQPADRAFEKFHAEVRHRLQSLPYSDEAWNKAIQELDPHTDVFRYFSKLLACQLADMGAPVQSELCTFALSQANFNPINIRVQQDSTFEAIASEWPDVQYAAHGGVVVFGNKKTYCPTTFYSTLTIGRVQYCFEARLNLLGQLQLALEFPVFFAWCMKEVWLATKRPIASEKLAQLGLGT